MFIMENVLNFRRKLLCHHDFLSKHVHIKKIKQVWKLPAIEGVLYRQYKFLHGIFSTR